MMMVTVGLQLVRGNRVLMIMGEHRELSITEPVTNPGLDVRATLGEARLLKSTGRRGPFGFRKGGKGATPFHHW